MEIKKLAQGVFDDVVRHRRYIHENPELSRMEDGTVAYIIAQLKELGIPYVDIPDGGVLATIEGARPGKRVLLRADIDALPVTEPENNLTQKRVCISKNPGVMHACGHDAHTAMLLGAAKILAEHREEIAGTVLLIFERGEEGGGNIRQIIQYFEREQVRYDACFGMHVDQKLPTGVVAVSEGGINAGSVSIDLTITGRGGHGSRPDLANNPVDCMVALLNEIYGIRMKYISPFEQLTTTICLIKAGTKSNIIPETVELAGSARYYSMEKVAVPFRAALDRIVKTCAESFGCTIENRCRLGTLPVVNHPQVSQIAQRAVAGALGEHALAVQSPSMGSESFALFTMMAPGCYASLGINTPEKGSGAEIHNQYFDIDEDAMVYGVAAHVAFALEFLGCDDKLDFTPDLDSLGQLVH